MTNDINPNYFELTSDISLINFIDRMRVAINNNTATTEDVKKAITAEMEAAARGLNCAPIVETYID